MLTKVDYANFNSSFGSATMEFETPNTKLKFEIIEEDDGSGNMIKKIKVTSIDELNVEISSTLVKNEVTQLNSLLQNMVKQI